MVSQSELLAKVRARAAAAEAASAASTSAAVAGAAATSSLSASVSGGLQATSARLASTPRKPALSKLVEYPGDEAEVARLLSEGGADPAGRDMFGLTALHKFVGKYARSCLAHPRPCPRPNPTPLITSPGTAPLSTAWDKPRLLELLLSHLASADLNAAGGDAKQTALHMAAEVGAVRSLRALLAHAAPNALDFGARDVAGKTPLDVARAAGCEEIRAILEEQRPETRAVSLE